MILDTLHSVTFTNGFIPGSVNIGLDGRFAEWAGSILPFEAPLLLVTEPGMEKESIVRLARVGYDKVKGFLQGGYEAWKNAGEKTDMIIDVEPDELLIDMPHDDKLVVLDVRRETEYADGHLKNALNIPLSEMNDPGSMTTLGEDENIYVHCQGGYRSVIACSLLKKQGFDNIRNVLGGWNKIKQQEKVEIVKEKQVLN